MESLNANAMRDGEALPLAHVTVLDLTLARAGPACVRHLADWGADVIRIEPPSVASEDVTGARDGPDYQNLHRNKRMVKLDLKSPEGREAFMRLAARADVVVENMRAAVKHRLHVAWEDVSKVNPRIVYGSISGFGQAGPYADRAGVDQIVQGMGGLMTITGEPGRGPMRAGIAVADVTAGNLLALAIMMALFERERTGRGRWVYTSLLEAQVHMLDFQGARYLMKGEVAGQTGNEHPTTVPTGVYPTADGAINIGASSTWERFCDAIGRPEWKERAEWRAQRTRNLERARINAEVAAITRTKPSAHWLEVFARAGVPSGPIHTIDAMFADPQVKALGIAAPVESPRLGAFHLLASPLNVAGVTKSIRHAAPDAGAHTAEVLKSVGYTDADIEAMRARHII